MEKLWKLLWPNYRVGYLYKSDDSDMITADHFTDVATDAPVNKPHMHKLDGTPLARNEQLSQEQKLGYIRDHSFPIPIQPMISALLDELA